MTISIRIFKPEEWPLIKTLRLEALKDSARLFSSSYEKESGYDDAFWQKTADGTGKCVFGLFDGDRAIGITAVFTFREDPGGETGVFGYSYLDPAYRGRGLTKLMYKARLEWSKDYLPFKRLVVFHREGNEASRRAIAANGFVFKQINRKTWPDNLEDNQYEYEIDLETLRKS